MVTKLEMQLSILLYEYIYIALLAVHTNQKRLEWRKQSRENEKTQTNLLTYTWLNSK